jgi:hypothetical protein
MKPWEQALKAVAQLLNHAEINWMLVGSAATAVHGAGIEPGDIDILIPTAGEVYTAAAVLPSKAEQSPTADPGTWHSTDTQPVLTWTDNTGSRWTFGRWTINRTKVELANLEPPEPSDAVIETGAAHSFALELSWHGTLLLVVPIELQIATMIARDQQQRLNATLAANHPDELNVGLLRRTLNDRHIEAADPRIPTALHQVLTANS